MNTTIKTFMDLRAWKEAHTLVLMTYTLSSQYPEEEKFGLVNQSRRASVSISSNIAEGFGRSTAKDKNHFYTMSLTSLAEIQNQILIARDLGYIKEKSFRDFWEQSVKVGNFVGALRKTSVGKE